MCPPTKIDEVIMGHARQAGSGPNPARQVAHRAGIPVGTTAQTINKACASGMQAIAAAAQSILLGESDCVVAGGIESMSRMPYLIDSADARWGHRMGHFPLVDAMYRDGFHDPLSNLIMGETAEILARQYGITREQSDQFALESQQKAEAAQKAGYFTREIAPVTLAVKPSLSTPTSIRGTARRSRRWRSCRLVFPRSKGSRASSPPGRRRASPMAAPRWCSRRIDGLRIAA